jgi:hypothetical protein
MRLLAGTVLIAALGAAAGCGSAIAAHTTAPRPTVTVTRTATPSPAHKVRHHHHRRAVVVPAASTPAPPAPVAAPAPNANSEAVVVQFYADLTNHDYATAWSLGGDNIAGTDYDSWVAGYSTTASLYLGTDATWNGPIVNAELIALQTGGSVKTYQGTYTVIGGVITAASIVQTS